MSLRWFVIVGVHEEKAACEGEAADDGRNDEHLRVEAQPGKVHGHLVPEIAPDEVQRLLFVPLAVVGPLQKQQLRTNLKLKSS